MDPRLAGAAVPQPPPPPPPTATVMSAADGLDGIPHTNGISNDAEGHKLRFCTVCASNQNRSMEAHLRLSLAGYPVVSFGTGSLVRLPGPSINQPNVYPFNQTSYATMYQELLDKDPKLYRQNGLLNMLERNKSVKWGPERWQDWSIGKPRLEHKEDRGSVGVEGGIVDVVFTCEERCWDAVVDNLLERGGILNKPVHVINVDIKDNHEEALIGGKAILDLAGILNKAAGEERSANGPQTGFDEQVPALLAEWQERWPHLPALWTLCWF